MSDNRDGPPSGKNYNTRRPQQKDMVDIFFCENWKQQVLVKRNGKHQALAKMVLTFEMMASMTLCFIAMSTGTLVVPAIAASAYTVASVNNSLDRNLHGLIGFLDSTAMITALTVFLISSLSTVGPLSGVLAYLAVLPFIGDGLISGVRSGQALRSSATVTEIKDEREENFINANENEEQYVERMHEPSEVLLPSVIQDSPSLNNLCTQSWRDNGFREDKSLMTQFLALAMVAGYAYLGGELVASGQNEVIGASSLVYAASGLLGYFGIGNAPVATFARSNIVSVILALMGVVAMITGGGMSLPLLMITMMHLFDVMQGASNEDPTLATSAYDSVGSTREQAGPVARFFLDSWKSDAFSRKNYFTCQLVQMLVMGVQAYLALICLFGGSGSFPIMGLYLAFIAASAYSYFSPMRLAGVDAIQSNGAQIALLGASTHHIVTAAPGISFYLLFCLLAVDSVMSFQQFFEENQHQVVRGTARQMGLLQKDEDNTNRGFSRDR